MTPREGWVEHASFATFSIFVKIRRGRSLRSRPFAAFALRKSDVVLAATKRAAEHITAVAPKVLIKWYDSPHDIPLLQPGEIADDIAAL